MSLKSLFTFCRRKLVMAYLHSETILKSIGRFLPLSHSTKSKIRAELERAFLGKEIKGTLKNLQYCESYETVKNILKTSEKIVLIDVQSLATKDFFRGIGRYTQKLSISLASNYPDWHFVLFTTNFGTSILVDNLFAYFRKVNISNLYLVQIDVFNDSNITDASTAEGVLSSRLEDLNPLVIIIPSFFHTRREVLEIDGPAGVITCGILHDLIPLQFTKEYLPTPSDLASYRQNVKRLKKCDYLFSVSQTSLDIFNKSFGGHPQQKVVGGASFFEDDLVGDGPLSARNGIFCIGGTGKSKNIEKFVKEYSNFKFPEANKYNLEIVGILNLKQRLHLRFLAFRSQPKITIRGFVSDHELRMAYQKSRVLVIPSLAEGLSLPVYEMWSHGGVVIGGRDTAVAETINCPEAVFNVEDFSDLQALLTRIVEDDSFWTKLRTSASKVNSSQTWKSVANNFKAPLSDFHLIHSNEAGQGGWV